MDLSLKVFITAGVVFLIMYISVRIMEVARIRLTVQWVAVILVVLCASALVTAVSGLWGIWSWVIK